MIRKWGLLAVVSLSGCGLPDLSGVYLGKITFESGTNSLTSDAGIAIADGDPSTTTIQTVTVGSLALPGSHQISATTISLEGTTFNGPLPTFFSGLCDPATGVAIDVKQGAIEVSNGTAQVSGTGTVICNDNTERSFTFAGSGLK